MRVLVVDDEQPARKRLIRMLGRIAGVEVIAEAGDGVEAREVLAETSLDVVLLDIEMPELDGLTLVELEPDIPPVVFTTAYDQHAVRAFELAAVDYLLKPIQQARLEQALQRASRLRAAQVAALHNAMRPAAPPRITARWGTSVRILDPGALTRIRAADKYTVAIVAGREFILDDSLNSLEKRLDAHGFLRVHRAELINLAAVRAFHARAVGRKQRADRPDDSSDGGSGGEVELTDGQRAPVSRRLAGELKRRLGLTTR